MEEENKFKGMNIVVFFIFLVTLLVVGIVAYNLATKQKNVSNNGTQTQNIQNELGESLVNNKEIKLSDEEINAINKYFNNTVYSQVPYLTFNEPADLLKEDNNRSYLEYIISRSKYATDTNENENVPSYKISLDGIKSILKDITNYTYNDNEISEYFKSNYDKNSKMYIFYGGGAGMAKTFVSGYKVDNIYYLTLNDNSSVVLQKINNNYYAYASTSDEKNNKNLIYDYEIIDKIGNKKLKTLKISNVDYTKVFNSKIGIYYDFTYDLQKDFIILSVKQSIYTYGGGYRLFIIDYSGKLLWEYQTNDANIGKAEYVRWYNGEFKYNKNENTLEFGTLIDLGNYWAEVDLLNEFKNLNENEKNKIASETEDVITYKMKYIDNGKFSEPQKVSSTKLSTNKHFMKMYVNTLGNLSIIVDNTEGTGYTPQIDKKINELKSNGYKECTIKNELNNLEKYNKSDDPQYKYKYVFAMYINGDLVDLKLRTIYIKEDGEMFINGRDTGYKYKMSCPGDEYTTIILTEDNYIYLPDLNEIPIYSKVKTILKKEADGLGYVTIVFEDGHVFEYTLD